MEAVKIDITGGSEEIVNAVAVAVNQGLSDAGFTNITTQTEVTDSEIFFEQIRTRLPEYFDTPIEISQISTGEDEAPADEAAEEADVDE